MKELKTVQEVLRELDTEKLVGTYRWHFPIGYEERVELLDMTVRDIQERVKAGLRLLIERLRTLPIKSPADGQQGLLFVHRIMKNGSHLSSLVFCQGVSYTFSAGCVSSHSDCSHHMARVQPSIVIQGHGTIVGRKFLQRNGVKGHPKGQLFRSGFPFDQIHHQLIDHLGKHKSGFGEFIWARQHLPCAEMAEL